MPAGALGRKVCKKRREKAILPCCAEAEGWRRGREAAGGMLKAEKPERLHPCACERVHKFRIRSRKMGVGWGDAGQAEMQSHVVEVMGGWGDE
jgi:hypothetical protein